MIELYKNGGYLLHGTEMIPEEKVAAVEQKLGRKVSKEEAKKGTSFKNDKRINKIHNNPPTLTEL